MPDLTPLTALGHDQPQSVTYGNLTMGDCPDLALASLTLRRDAPVPLPFGLDLPGPGGYVASAEVAAIWTGPRQWMIEAKAKGCTDFAAQVKAQAPDAIVTEQTDGWAAFDITSPDGAAIGRLLEKLVNIDPGTVSPGTASRTSLHHMNVLLVRPDPCCLRIWVGRSFAGSLWHAVIGAAARQAA
ncbi:sarcosine oxidase subunit gamma [Sulfitobacter pseudonitzschiae]|uniref:Sarcosine oxidase subunit gamma n=1 Tax=Pseudosulfitobacter pseudonitzschiae TaxID=1402135 RepID=A0A9Q2RZ56_9RHOB|nr:hypothetical protein [Sulfitobacter sp. 20_GPM-1509m]MBM2294323.1 sarcosine oxidase subunit gamma [Pseudosulfitobacter pseudonitzschiae]MBM2299248.1 sarcosine oxidase subunit gamma [Pseudosulfitobacter pseudonitzschiae]MBM2304156.1 sarcosine oxidase subunit gamma [Pseudosulfitobacter pseudonitzschiae]MBM2313936.1 sarcosine oxidase subunit gamma [Pseudosulfitobacter pseudonitzschiae]MBM2318850.1 sarcosine oxidase subunit gamma [Pseudosulfitobacter pseudonitzschiae]